MKWFLRFLIVFVLLFTALVGGYVLVTGQAPGILARGTGDETPANAEAPTVAEHGQPESPPHPADHPFTETASASVLEQLNNEYVGLVTDVMPSVVSITTKRQYQMVRNASPLELYFAQVAKSLDIDPAEHFRRTGRIQERTEIGFGSGVIISSDGLVVTSHHVIEGKQDIILLLSDGREISPEVLASDPDSDIAVLRIPELDDLNPIPLGNSDAVRVGEMVFAIGNPYGLNETVSRGIISAKGRAPRSELRHQEFLQTDAVIHLGHSGGPLVNIRGDLIGINRKAYFGDRRSPNWQGIAFATPVNNVRSAVSEILSAMGPSAVFPGAEVADEPPPPKREDLGLSEHEGVFLERVYPGSPADREGLRELDYVTTVDGQPVATVEELRKQLNEVTLGTFAEVGIIRDGLPLALQVAVNRHSEAPKI
jgi:S1-C subfamily serine protease